MKRRITRLSSLLLAAMLVFGMVSLQAASGKTERLTLPSGNGEIVISNFVTVKEETLHLNGEAQLHKVYYVDDATTIHFNVKSDDIVGGISSVQWEDGQYVEFGDLFLGDEWGWPELNAKSLLSGESLMRAIFIVDHSDPVEEGEGWVSYARQDFYIRAAGEGEGPAANEGFSDVPAGAYYAEAVKWAVEQNITTGTSATTFSPETVCTTAEILTFLWRAHGSPDPAGDSPFANVTADAYYADAAAWAYEQGLISGDAFDSEAPCTRAATVTYLWKLAGAPEQPGDLGLLFSDVSGDANYAAAVGWALREGITAGTSDTLFSPDTTCTRGQIMTFLYRDLVL